LSDDVQDTDCTQYIFPHSSSGLGLATVKNLLQADAFVSVLDLSRSPAVPDNSRVKFMKCDVTNVEEIRKAVEETVKWTGETGASLGGVVNCAGVATAAKVESDFGSILNVH
jgi:NAD(P)-dependent dehydrogenase (short-subunit alcohol dehydrogenase family)